MRFLGKFLSIPRVEQRIVSEALLFLLIVRFGQTQLCLGVAREGNAELAAHAWLECDGEIRMGGEESPTRFMPFPTIHGPLSIRQLAFKPRTEKVNPCE